MTGEGMSEMVERVAIAIANAHGDAWDDVPDSKVEWTERRGEFGNRFRGVDENFKDDYRDEARAAIAAMREPPVSVRFDNEGSDRWSWTCHVCGGPKENWERCIDAALKDSK